MGVEAFEHDGKITARNAPVERSRRVVVADLEALDDARSSRTVRSAIGALTN
jgi:hypothetical protein